MTVNQAESAAAREGGHSGRRGGGGGVVLPNGVKPKPRKPEKYEMRSDGKGALKEDTDEDDDWC